MKVSCHFQGRHSLIEMENIWYTWIYRYVGNMCMCEVLKWQIMTDQWKYKQNPPTHSFICWLTHSFIRWLTDSHSLTHIHSLTQSLTHPPNHLPTTHSLTHSLTHSPNRLPFHPHTQFHTSLTHIPHPFNFIPRSIISQNMSPKLGNCTNTIPWYLQNTLCSHRIRFIPMVYKGRIFYQIFASRPWNISIL